MNPTTLDEIRDVLLTWAFDITGREVILSNSGDGEAPRPRNPYLEVFVEQYDSPTDSVVVLSEDGLSETVSANTLLTVTLDVYGNNPMQDTSKLMRSLYSSNRYLDLWVISGLGGIETATDLTALGRGSLKQRAQIRFTLYCILHDTFTSDYFDIVEAELTSDDKGTENIESGQNPRQKADICPL